MNKDDMERSFEEEVESLPFVESADIPDIDLYMDQVLTFLERKLAPITDDKNERPITKTMINNYVKAGVLPPPEKKKYTREHMIYLLLLYFLKSLYSIDDTGKLLGILRDLTEEKTDEKKDNKDDTTQVEENSALLSLPALYDALNEELKDQAGDSAKSAKEAFEKAEKAFSDLDCTEEQREQLRTFDAMMRLSLDAYLKKRYVEKLLEERDT